MGDKESGRYQCYEYPAKHNNTLKREPPSSLKAGTSSGAPGGAMVGAPKSRRCCSCLGPKSAPFWVGLLTNLGICTLLFAYTLLGSFIFLAIEGGASTMQQKTLASTNRQMKPSPTVRSDNVTFSPAAIQDTLEARQRAVENIWDITVSLNILYRENWTRLAALEIARFQEQLIKRLTDDMVAQGAHQDTGSPSTGAVIVQTTSLGQEYDWTFARAFLYSLTVLTTIAIPGPQAQAVNLSLPENSEIRPLSPGIYETMRPREFGSNSGGYEIMRSPVPPQYENVQPHRMDFYNNIYGFGESRPPTPIPFGRTQSTESLAAILEPHVNLLCDEDIEEMLDHIAQELTGQGTQTNTTLENGQPQ